MIRIIHCADLHLSSKEKVYSLNVLKEIVEQAVKKHANYLLFAGDTFDRFSELANLHKEFANALSPLAGICEIFFIAGNHEFLDRNKSKISAYELGIPAENIIDIDASPFRLISRDGIEIIAIPHQKDYKGYTEWPVPEKKATLRIALAHAANEDLSFTGLFEEEDKAGVIDSDLFQRYHVDYAALGHIHTKSEKTIGRVIMAYPGSPRVWRKDECGPRYINMLECSDSIKLKQIEITTAGQFRRYSIDLDLDGMPKIEINKLAMEWDSCDWIWIDLQGLVEDVSVVDALSREYKHDHEKRVRKIDINTDSIVSCAGISSQEIAKKFLEIWEGAKPAQLGDELAVWERAREIGLRKIKEHMEARA